MYSSASHPSAMRQSSTGSLGSSGYGGDSGNGSGAHQPPLSQQHFTSGYVDYSSPVHPSRSMHGDGGSGSSGGMRGQSGGGGGGGNYSTVAPSYAPAPSGSSGVGMKYAQQQQQQQPNAGMAPRAPGGSSYSSSGLSHANGNGGRDLAPISHQGMQQRSTQQPQQQPQHRYSNSSSSYQALPSAYTGNVGPIGSLQGSLSDPWSDTSSPIGGGGNNSYAYPSMAGSAQTLMPLPPHPSAVPPAKGGGGAGKKSNAAASAHSAISSGGAPFLPPPPPSDPEPDLPKPPRVDLSVRKQTLDALLGDAATAHTYWNLVEKYLLVKLSKAELDAFVLEKLGRNNVHVHNDFFLAVLQNALSDDLPPKPPTRKKTGERKPRVKNEAATAAAAAAKGAGKKSAGGSTDALKKERKPRSKKKDASAVSGGGAGKKSKRKSRTADEELLTSVGAYLSSPHMHAAGAAHKPMAHLLRPAQNFEALENLKYSDNHSASAAGPTALEYGQGGNFDAGAANLSGTWASAPHNRVPVPNGIPPLEGHLQTPRLVHPTSNSCSIEHAQQMMQALFKPRPIPRAQQQPQQPHPPTSQLSLPRAKSASPRSSMMQTDSAAASTSSSALSTVMHTPSPSSASPSQLVRDVLPLSFTSDYTAHWGASAAATAQLQAAQQQRRKSFQTQAAQFVAASATSAAVDPNSMDDDEASPSTAAADGLHATSDDLDDDDEADCDDELEDSDPYARLGDPETRAYLSALYSQRVPDRDAVRKRLYTSALYSGVPNVSESAVSLLQQATEEHLKSIIASILEYARPQDQRGAMVRVLEQNTVGATEAASMEDQDATVGADSGAAAPSMSPSSANASVAAAVPMDESTQSSSDAPAGSAAAPATSGNGLVSLPPAQPVSASVASAPAVASFSFTDVPVPAAAAPTPAPATAAAAAAASSAPDSSAPMTTAERIAYVRDAMSGPHADPLLLPPLRHHTWASVNAHMPVDRSDSPPPPLRVDAPMRMPLSTAQLTAALHQYPELLSSSTAPLILERLSACQ